MTVSCASASTPSRPTCVSITGRGILPFGGATLRAAAQLGWGNAMWFLLTAEEFGAEQALIRQSGEERLQRVDDDAAGLDPGDGVHTFSTSGEPSSPVGRKINTMTRMANTATSLYSMLK